MNIYCFGSRHAHYQQPNPEVHCDVIAVFTVGLCLGLRACGFIYVNYFSCLSYVVSKQ